MKSIAARGRKLLKEQYLRIHDKKASKGEQKLLPDSSKRQRQQRRLSAVAAVMWDKKVRLRTVRFLLFYPPVESFAGERTLTFK